LQREGASSIGQTRFSSHIPRSKLSYLTESFWATRTLLGLVMRRRVDIVFVSRAEDYVELSHRQFVNKTVEALKKTYGSDLSILQVVTDEGVPNKRLGTRDDLLVLRGISTLSKVLAFLFSWRRGAIVKKIKNDKNLVDQLGSLEIDVESLAIEIHRLYHLSNSYRLLLWHSRPSVVIYQYFYRLTGLALGLAATRSLTPSIEYQHGIQNDFHGMYSHWINVPSKGYEMLPEVFWLWGEEFKKKLGTLLKPHMRHKALVGGNILLNARTSSRSGEKGSKPGKRDVGRSILVTLQGDKFYKPFLLEAVVRLQSFVWLFRDHPRHPISEDIKLTLAKFSNRPMHEIAQQDLYALLSTVDLHITATSTVALEAAAFGVPTLFLDNYARSGFGVLCDDEVSVANSSQQVIDWVNARGDESAEPLTRSFEGVSTQISDLLRGTL